MIKQTIQFWIEANYNIIHHLALVDLSHSIFFIGNLSDIFAVKFARWLRDGEEI